MKQRISQIINIICIVVLILILTACRHTEEIDSDGNIVRYSATVYSLPDNLTNIEHLRHYNGTIIAVVNLLEGDALITRIVNIKPDGTEYSLLNYERSRKESTIVQMDIALDGTIWVIEALEENDNNRIAQDNPHRYYVKKLNERGDAILDMPLVLSNAPIFSIDYFCVTSDDKLYIVDRGVIYIMDNTLKVHSTIPVGNLNGLTVSEDGIVYALLDSIEGLVIRSINAQDGTLGKIIASPSHNCGVIISGESLGFDFLSYDTAFLYAYDSNTGIETKILDWRDIDLDGFMSSLLLLDDGRIHCCRFIPSDGDAVTIEFVILNKIEHYVEEKTVLTLATFSLSSELSAQISRFNATNDKFRISVINYSSAANNGINMLNIELITGNGPDIIDLKSIPGNIYAANGFLEDLYPYIDADPMISRNDFLESIMSSLDHDGMLYEAVSSFSVTTMIGRMSDVGEQIGWTFDDMKTLHMQKATDSAIANVTKELFLQLVCNFACEEFVDWSTGTVNFDSNSFISLLEYCANLPADNSIMDEYIDNPELILSGQSFLCLVSVYDFFEIQFYEWVFNDEITYIGIPSEYGTGSYFVTNTALALNSSSENKDAAWEFIRLFLTEDYQKSNSAKYGFPTNKVALDAMIDTVRVTNTLSDSSNNDSILQSSGFSWNNVNVEYQPVSQYHIEKITSLINNASGIMRTDESILTIISETSRALFANERSAQDTARIIQNRVVNYVNEQRVSQ